MQDVMLFLFAQPTLVNVFELSKCIKLNMVKECAMILEFSKDKSQSFSTSSIQ